MSLTNISNKFSSLYSKYSFRLENMDTITSLFHLLGKISWPSRYLKFIPQFISLRSTFHSMIDWYITSLNKKSFEEYTSWNKPPISIVVLIRNDICLTQVWSYLNISFSVYFCLSFDLISHFYSLCGISLSVDRQSSTIPQLRRINKAFNHTHTPLHNFHPVDR